MHAYLIVGGTQETRMRRLRDNLISRGVSVFDQTKIITQNDSIGIKEVRTFIADLQLKPSGTIRAGIIENADLLTEPAQQALLKTIEEPPSQVILFFAAKSSESLLPTIQSRCQVILADLEKQTIPEPSPINIKKQAAPASIVQLVESLGKEKDDALSFIDTMLFTIHTNLDKPSLIPLAHALLHVKKLAQNNISISMLIENAFLLNSIDNGETFV